MSKKAKALNNILEEISAHADDVTNLIPIADAAPRYSDVHDEISQIFHHCEEIKEKANALETMINDFIDTRFR